MFRCFFLLFLMTINNIFPFDKISIVLLILILRPQLKKLNIIVSLIIALLFISFFLSYIINFGNSSLRIFYPLLFFTGAYLLNLRCLNIKTISYLFLPNIIVGIIGVLYSILSDFEPNIFAVYAWGKSFLFPICATGFSPTPQVYGTFCILYIWVCLEKKNVDLGFLLSIIGVLLSQNRTSYVFALFILIMYKKKFFFLIPIIMLVIYYYSNDWLMELFNNTNLDSREANRHQFEIVYWNSNDFSRLFWGIGNNEVHPQLLGKTDVSSYYIENGLDFVLAISGINGLILSAIIFIHYIMILIKKRNFKICFIICFYMVVNQWMTQEFLASSFFFFMLFVLALNQNIMYNKTEGENPLVKSR